MSTTLNLRLNIGRLRSPLAGAPDKLTFSERLIQLAREIAAGMLDPITIRGEDTPVAPSGTFTVATGSGTLTATINGVAIAVTATGVDADDAALVAAAINASSNALVTGLVSATSALGVVTVTGVGSSLGKSGNAITTAASGTGFTAQQARLTGGTDGTVTNFTF